MSDYDIAADEGEGGGVKPRMLSGSALPPETGYIQIGAFYIARRNDGTYWIERESGEGMQTGEAFEKAIAQFYKENF